MPARPLVPRLLILACFRRARPSGFRSNSHGPSFPHLFGVLSHRSPSSSGHEDDHSALKDFRSGCTNFSIGVDIGEFCALGLFGISNIRWRPSTPSLRWRGFLNLALLFYYPFIRWRGFLNLALHPHTRWRGFLNLAL